MRSIVGEIISGMFCHRVRKFAVMEIIKTGSFIFRDGSKESDRMENTLLRLHKVPFLGDLSIIIFMIPTAHSKKNDKFKSLECECLNFPNGMDCTE